MLIDISLACGDAVGREVQVRDLPRAEGIYLRQALTEGNVIVERDSTVRDVRIPSGSFEAGIMADRDVLDAKVQSIGLRSGDSGTAVRNDKSGR